MPRIQTIIVPYNPDNRNAQGETLIAFDPDVVGNNPVALLMPWWDGQKASVGGIPTVSGITVSNGVGTMTVADTNAASNYYLNALLVDPEIDDVHGLRAIANTVAKTTDGLLNVPGLPEGDNVNMLTAYWNGHHGMVGTVETVSSETTQPSAPYSTVTTVSGNHASDYYVNALSCQRNSVPHAAQSGTAHKVAGDVLRVYFPTAWTNPPVVFVTPFWSNRNARVGSIETINEVTETYFEVASGNRADDYYVNWLAVTSNPNFKKETVDTGFQDFLAAHPEEAAQIAEHRQALENAILNGAPAPAGMAKMQRKRSAPPAPVPEFSGLQIFKDAASLALDGVGLIIAGMGINNALSLTAQQRIVNMLAAGMQQVEGEVMPLINALGRAQGVLTRIETMAGTLLKFVAGLASLGVLKTIIYEILASLSWWDWVVASVKLAAQLAVLIGALILSAGFAAAASVIAWIGRIASLLMASVAVVTDITKLVEDIASGNRASPT